jgi:hypothetical protein
MQSIRIRQGDHFDVPPNQACTVFLGKSDHADVIVGDSGERIGLVNNDKHHFEASLVGIQIVATTGSIGVILHDSPPPVVPEPAADTIEIPLDGTHSLVSVVHHRGYVPQLKLIDSDGNTITFAESHNDTVSASISTTLPVLGTLIIY